MPIPILDLFAGPGGLGEGFSRLPAPSGSPAFRLRLSVEMDPHAHRTLTLRAFVREFVGREAQLRPDYAAFAKGEITWDELMGRHPKEAKAAQEEALCATMGQEADDKRVDACIKAIKHEFREKPGILIGGPPCQAYSLVGRARNKGISDYDAELDHRHVLYEQYLRILREVQPAIFVMENVKGILSAKLKSKGGHIFGAICSDFRKAGYQLHSLSPHLPDGAFDDNLEPHDFLLRAEEHGVPQARHRVILIGLHKSLFDALKRQRKSFDASQWRLPFFGGSDAPDSWVPVEAVLGGMPPIRSGISRHEESGWDLWRAAIHQQIKNLILDRGLRHDLQDAAEHLLSARKLHGVAGRGGAFVAKVPDPINAGRFKDLKKWIEAPWLEGTANHEARGHMPSDLLRYLFCSHFAAKEGHSPTLRDFPDALLPDHANAADAASGNGVFADRFRVQVKGRPSSTVTAHISKDGHYFIHPDPRQCRSLTVREAARLQTFPDDYLFQGPRTEQYRQVGNAVPPFLAHQIAGVLHRLIRTAWPTH